MPLRRGRRREWMKSELCRAVGCQRLALQGCIPLLLPLLGGLFQYRRAVVSPLANAAIVKRLNNNDREIAIPQSKDRTFTSLHLHLKRMPLLAAGGSSALAQII
jgi:hypothetical protein